MSLRALLAIDVDDASHVALLEEAERWAKTLSATLDLLHVEGGKYGFGFVNNADARRILEVEAVQMRSRDRTMLDALLMSLPLEHRGTADITEGDPVAQILAHAADRDLLMIGTHGRRGLSQIWLGSVAEKVIRKAPGAVLVLRLHR
jgi:nucleotide-binding universal stress UspA family protein